MLKEKLKIQKMDKKQYNYSNMFWNKEDFSLEEGLPKYTNVDETTGIVSFEHLNKTEISEFLHIKSQEDPTILVDLRYKKLMRIKNKGKI